EPPRYRSREYLPSITWPSHCFQSWDMIKLLHAFSWGNSIVPEPAARCIDRKLARCPSGQGGNLDPLRGFLSCVIEPRTGGGILRAAPAPYSPIERNYGTSFRVFPATTSMCS